MHPKKVSVAAGRETGTAEERIAAANEEPRDALAAELIDRIEEGSWERFEQLVLDVLKKMGYGGLGGAVERIGGHGSDGVWTVPSAKTSSGWS